MLSTARRACALDHHSLIGHVICPVCLESIAATEITETDKGEFTLNLTVKLYLNEERILQWRSDGLPEEEIIKRVKKAFDIAPNTLVLDYDIK